MYESGQSVLYFVGYSSTLCASALLLIHTFDYYANSQVILLKR